MRHVVVGHVEAALQHTHTPAFPPLVVVDASRAVAVAAGVLCLSPTMQARCSAFRGVVCSSPAPLLLQGSCSCASRSRQHGAPGVEFATAAAAASKLTTRQQALQPHTVAAAAVASKAAAVADRTPAAGAGKSLMIVESPTKATKIQKFLGDEYQVCLCVAGWCGVGWPACHSKYGRRAQVLRPRRRRASLMIHSGAAGCRRLRRPSAT